MVDRDTLPNIPQKENTLARCQFVRALLNPSDLSEKTGAKSELEVSMEKISKTFEARYGSHWKELITGPMALLAEMTGVFTDDATFNKFGIDHFVVATLYAGYDIGDVDIVGDFVPDMNSLFQKRGILKAGRNSERVINRLMVSGAYLRRYIEGEDDTLPLDSPFRGLIDSLDLGSNNEPTPK